MHFVSNYAQVFDVAFPHYKPQSTKTTETDDAAAINVAASQTPLAPVDYARVDLPAAAGMGGGP